MDNFHKVLLDEIGSILSFIKIEAESVSMITIYLDSENHIKTFDGVLKLYFNEIFSGIETHIDESLFDHYEEKIVRYLEKTISLQKVSMNQ